MLLQTMTHGNLASVEYMLYMNAFDLRVRNGILVGLFCWQIPRKEGVPATAWNDSCNEKLALNLTLPESV